MPPEPQRALLSFYSAGRVAAVPLESVERIVPMAQLACPPSLPSLLKGILNLAGRSVPVLRLDRLLQLPEQPPGLYSMLIVLKGLSDSQIAVLVDRVSEVLTVPVSALLPIGKEDSFNACVEAVVYLRDHCDDSCAFSHSHPPREGTRGPFPEFQAMAQQRLQAWEPEGL